MARIRFRVPHLLWRAGETENFSEPGATELVVSGIAEYEGADAIPIERPAIAIAPTALPKAKPKRKRTR